MRLQDIVYETPSKRYWVCRVRYGFDVMENTATCAKRVGIIGYKGDDGLQRAIAEADRREALAVSG